MTAELSQSSRKWTYWLAGGLALWIASAAIVVAVHAGAGVALAYWGKSSPAGSPEVAVMLDLSTEAASPSTEKTDVAPDQILQQQAEKQPEPVEKPVEKEPEPELEPQKAEPPRKAEVELPQPTPVVKPPKKKMAALNTRPIAAEKEAPTAVAPPPGALGRARADWNSMIVAHLNRYKNAPSGLQSPGGVVTVDFAIDRSGKLLSSRVAHGSGMSELDREAMEMLRRAQPFPPPPPELAGVRFPFNVPVRYTVR
jgi:protein TonB